MKIEYDLNFFVFKLKWRPQKNGRQPNLNIKKLKMEDDLKINKIEDDIKHNLKKSTLIGCDILVN